MTVIDSKNRFPKEKFLTIAEAAALLHVSRNTIAGWIHENKIPYVREKNLGIRIHRSTVDEIIEGLVLEQSKDSLRPGRPSLLRGRDRGAFSFKDSGTRGDGKESGDDSSGGTAEEGGDRDSDT